MAKPKPDPELTPRPSLRPTDLHPFYIRRFGDRLAIGLSVTAVLTPQQTRDFIADLARESGLRNPLDEQPKGGE